MNRIYSINLLFIFLIGAFFSSCAPVKFQKTSVAVVPFCSGAGCITDGPQITCDPKINSSATTYTYVTGGVLPNISSQCNPSQVDYTWVVKRADTSLISATIPGLSGANPVGVDFTGLGPGSYYVYLTASKTGSTYASFNASTPLEFIVGGVGNQLICDPKLNQTLTSITLGSADNNAQISANCNPAAGSYIWSVTKDNNPIAIAGLSGGTSTPDIKSYGAGVYRVSLYATVIGSQHWQSSTPLVITIVNPPAPTTPIACNPRINGSMTALSIMRSSPHPLISANCIPSNGIYSWTVTRNGNPVTVAGLAGANSNPNFLALGTGTYLIYLNVTATNYTAWNTTTPLTLTVDSGSGGQNVNCAPRLNSTAVSTTITQSGSNPLVTSSCIPSNAVHSWSVFKDGVPIVISGLSGPSSTPNFTGAGLGTYQVYLTAAASGYNAYVTPWPLEVVVSATASPYRPMSIQKVVQATDNKVDIVVVVDDSNSMLPENTKLAERLQGFVNDLTTSGIDWQICATVTHDQVSSGNMYWGLSRNWVSYTGTPQWVLRSNANDPYTIFTNTIAAIGAGWANTDDERPLKAAFFHAEYNPYNTCYRNDAALSVLMLSDEDERSVGGDPGAVFFSNELKYLDADDQPHGYINKIKQLFGIGKRLSVNSIIVKPNDSACLASQDATTKSHYGYKLNELSHLTNGFVGSICDTNYSNSLYYFRDRIVTSLASIPLECAPVGPITVSITPAMGVVNTSLQNNTVVFSPTIPPGRTVNIQYNCSQN
ncbi:MAG: hypothetical protein A2622_03130 [Bdellovibrionales bacterium RIFCSPHIGHO2_01_FULL_40_29]|nr:MAG: hypothetical protein A2622_03130 [Bdellovibrionales bacterium RIFCSPHIGHO2_01_FULL_40_29]OFZ34066.1 MAG: hypothetical protein A3D17_03550 [Bdellovibrionales bacterium RIFCSPHIGHO2_02_FULL_40_15]